MKRKYTHLHKYEKVNLGKKNYTVFRCTIPGCDHYVRKELAKGKICQCNRCGEAMILDAFSIGLTRPHCISCTNRRKESAFKELHNVVTEKLG